MPEQKDITDIIQSPWKGFLSQASPFWKPEYLRQYNASFQVPPRLVTLPNFDQNWQAIPDNTGSYVDDLGRRVSVRRRKIDGTLTTVNDVHWAAYNAARFCLLPAPSEQEPASVDVPANILLHKRLNKIQMELGEEIRELIAPELMQLRIPLYTRIFSGATAEPYAYSALRNEHSAIRLVVLLPAEEINADIECELHDGILAGSSTDKYEALSYVWGNASRSKSITVNGQPFLVTENLEVALRHLRHRDRGRVLWIDSICINQRDTEETSSQVQKMGLIYNSAERVVVWLGLELESDLSDRALDNMSEKPFQAYDPANNPYGMKAEIELELKLNENNARPMNPKLADPKLFQQGFSKMMKTLVTPENYHRLSNAPSLENGTAVDALLDRPWFKRVWCIQEIKLARHAIFQCGQRTVASEYFGSAVTIKVMIPEDFLEGSQSSSLPMPTEFGASHSGLYSWTITEKNARNWVLGLLSVFSRWEASDPRDKVFALYSIVPANAPDKDVLKPDYSLCAAEVYTKVAVHFLRTYRKLDVLCMAPRVVNYVTDVSRHGLLPSWVPDWRDHQRGKREDIPEPLALCGKGGDIPYFDNNYNASLGREVPRINIRDFDQGLRLDGINVDTIEAMSDVYTSFVTPSKTPFEVLLRQWKEIAGLSKAGRYQFPDQPVLEAWWRTILGDTREDFINSDEIRTRQRIPPENIQSRWFSDRPPSDNHFFQAVSQASYQHAPICGRRFFKTARGLFGLAPASAQKGDNVVVLFGGTVPFILRQFEDVYHLVGESYVHGIMDGEVISKPSTHWFQDLEEESFILC